MRSGERTVFESLVLRPWSLVRLWSLVRPWFLVRRPWSAVAMDDGPGPKDAPRTKNQIPGTSLRPGARMLRFQRAASCRFLLRFGGLALTRIHVGDHVMA